MLGKFATLAAPLFASELQMSAPKECLLLAAGLSSRMGRWKQMLPFAGRPLIEHALDNALQFCDRVVVVTGFRGEELRGRLAHYDRVEFVHNHDFADGMFSSIQCGVREIHAEHFFITHGDLPLLPRRIYSQLWSARGADACFPCWQGRRGHPALISHQLVDAISSAPKGAAMRDLLRDRAVLELELGCPEVRFDIDTPAAYQALLARFEGVAG